MNIGIMPAKMRTTVMKLEVVVIPVSNADDAKRFYNGLGWREDADFAFDDGFRVIQFTPPGSSTSIIFGKGVTSAPPGSATGLYLIVSDLEAARQDLLRRGVMVTEAFHGGSDRHVGVDAAYLFGTVRVSGYDPGRRSYLSLASFNDPDGNGWFLQEVTERLPGRVEGDAAFTSRMELASALRRAAAAHDEHEAKTRHYDVNWPDWYADYIVNEQVGKRQ
ncbi:VOC family protein [Tardiphaga robiniae]|uniref:Glyoxalase n=1 Tax=Tardiphaga robiniae TaxID=943830 RepID=A0A7G6TU05_9BRAD|nr:VOC family protein [Tardiphaga robiniae]QND70237.1 glyoxalase [Tardiphaga robiniae]